MKHTNPHHATFNSPYDIPSTTPRFGLQVINFLHLTDAFLVSTATLKTTLHITIVQSALSSFVHSVSVRASVNRVHISPFRGL